MSNKFLSKRTQLALPSVTLQINENMIALQKEGKDIFNLTSGQLPFRPESNFILSLQHQLNFLASYQYSPVQGLFELREKLKNDWYEQKLVSFNVPKPATEMIISHGSKHALFNLFATIINPGDEVVLFSPYWVSFPEMVSFWQGIPKVVECYHHDAFTPNLDHLRTSINDKTKAIIVNSPNNPTGVHYSAQWMQDFATIMNDFPNVLIISDEVYDQLYYYDPAPTFFYQYQPNLLQQTVIVNGISKCLASTGLRLGTALGPAAIIKEMSKLQGNSTSGANSLVQFALLEYEFKNYKNYLQEIRLNLRKSAEILKDSFRQFQLSTCWYQTTSAFYFMLDFTRTPYFKIHYAGKPAGDYSQEICKKMLQTASVGVVPGTNFGIQNSARISFTLDPDHFAKACYQLCHFLQAKVAAS